MTSFTPRRLASMVVVLIALVAVMFLLQKLSHTDPVHAYLGGNASTEAVAHERHALGYDRPIIDQFFTYVGHAVQGNLSDSLRTRRPVSTDIREYLPATAEL